MNRSHWSLGLGHWSFLVQHLLEPTADLKSWLADRGHPAYRAAQVRKWIYEKRAGSFDEMTDLPKKLRDDLAAKWQIWTSKIARHEQSPDGTEKLLLELADGGRIECVLLRDDDRRSICISTQVGCAMGCVFCASGLDGVDRGLRSARRRLTYAPTGIAAERSWTNC